MQSFRLSGSMLGIRAHQIGKWWVSFQIDGSCFHKGGMAGSRYELINKWLFSTVHSYSLNIMRNWSRTYWLVIDHCVELSPSDLWSGGLPDNWWVSGPTCWATATPQGEHVMGEGTLSISRSGDVSAVNFMGCWIEFFHVYAWFHKETAKWINA